MSSELSACVQIKDSILVPPDLLKIAGVAYLSDLVISLNPKATITILLLADGRFDRQPDDAWVDVVGAMSPGRLGAAVTVFVDQLKAAGTCEPTQGVSVLLGKVSDKHDTAIGCLLVETGPSLKTKGEASFRALLSQQTLIEHDFAAVEQGDWATIKGKIGGLRLGRGGSILPVILPSESYTFWSPTFDGRTVKRTFSSTISATVRPRRQSISGEVQPPLDLDDLENGSEWYWDGEGLPPSSWYDSLAPVRAVSAPPASRAPYFNLDGRHTDGAADSEGSEDGARTPPIFSSDNAFSDPVFPWGINHRGSTTSTDGIQASTVLRLDNPPKDDE